MGNIMSLDCCRLCYSELFPEPIMQLNGMPKAAQYYPTKDEFVEDKEYGNKFMSLIKKHEILITRNHGYYTVGKTAAEAFFKAY